MFSSVPFFPILLYYYGNPFPSLLSGIRYREPGALPSTPVSRYKRKSGPWCSGMILSSYCPVDEVTITQIVTNIWCESSFNILPCPTIFTVYWAFLAQELHLWNLLSWVTKVCSESKMEKRECMVVNWLLEMRSIIVVQYVIWWKALEYTNKRQLRRNRPDETTGRWTNLGLARQCQCNLTCKYYFLPVQYDMVSESVCYSVKF